MIESAGTNVDPKTGERVAVKIKSHHNVGGLPKDLQFKLVEPLRKLFKDEVRKVGRTLGLPEEIVRRHPFPGPGLAIRILGEVTDEKLNCLRDADLIVREEIREAGLYHDIWQAFAVLLPVRSVGVMGDKRTYAWPIVLRCVSSEDGMTADWSRLPYDLMETISNRIVNEVKGSTASSSTSPASPLAPSSGSDVVAAVFSALFLVVVTLSWCRPVGACFPCRPQQVRYAVVPQVAALERLQLDSLRQGPSRPQDSDQFHVFSTPA